MDCLEAQINSVEDRKEQTDLQELYTYYKNNFEALMDYYSRGIEIPETREPGVIHHARLGSMESNVFTLIGNRMKGRRMSWSIQGANHLASLLCAYHTTGMQGIFQGPERKDVNINHIVLPSFSAAKVQTTAGHGYEPEHSSHLPPIPWLKEISAFQSLSDIKI